MIISFDFETEFLSPIQSGKFIINRKVEALLYEQLQKMKNMSMIHLGHLNSPIHPPKFCMPKKDNETKEPLFQEDKEDSPDYTRNLEQQIIAMKLEVAESRTLADKHLQNSIALGAELDELKRTSDILAAERDDLLAKMKKLESYVSLLQEDVKEAETSKSELQGEYNNLNDNLDVVLKEFREIKGERDGLLVNTTKNTDEKIDRRKFLIKKDSSMTSKRGSIKIDGTAKTHHLKLFASFSENDSVSEVSS